MADKHPRRHAPRRPSPSVLERINPNAAGIDCGSAEHHVAVPPDRDPQPVQFFQTFTKDLIRLADWLTRCGVTSVAMEATGVYWIPLFEILDARGFEVRLVNAHHVKNVPGRKSDVSDCEWLRELEIVGLLRGSFRPSDSIVALRGYLRHRHTLVEQAGIHVQRMQKALARSGSPDCMDLGEHGALREHALKGAADPDPRSMHRAKPNSVPARLASCRRCLSS